MVSLSSHFVSPIYLYSWLVHPLLELLLDASQQKLKPMRKHQVLLVVESLATQIGTIKDSNHPKERMATSLTSLPMSEVLMASNQNKQKETHQNSHIAITSSRTTTGNGE